MASHEFTVAGDPARAKQTAIDALVARGFQLGWTDEWTGRAEKGSKVKNLLFGAFAQYMEVGVAVNSLDAEHSIIRIDTLTSGWMGGFFGARKTQQNFESLRDELGNSFNAAGVLVNHRNPAAPA